MANYKTRSDDEIAWSNKPGNRGKTYPGDEIARKEYDRDKARGENNLSIVRNFLFGKSDARKRDVENAVNARRDAGKSIPTEPYVKPAVNTKQNIPTQRDGRNYYPDKKSYPSKNLGKGQGDFLQNLADAKDARNKSPYGGAGEKRSAQQVANDITSAQLAAEAVEAEDDPFKKGGMIKTKKMASGGTASSRADGIAQRGKTKGRVC